jgi:hypothetical protein
MAVWQHQFQLIGADGAAIERLAETSLFAELDAVLPRRKSWSPEILQWGDLEESVLEIMTTDGIVDEVRFRVDVRGRWREVLSSLWHAGARAGLKFYSDVSARELIDLTDAENEVENSSAARFAENPGRWLDEQSDR